MIGIGRVKTKNNYNDTGIGDVHVYDFTPVDGVYPKKVCYTSILMQMEK